MKVCQKSKRNVKKSISSPHFLPVYNNLYILISNNNLDKQQDVKQLWISQS